MSWFKQSSPTSSSSPAPTPRGWPSSRKRAASISTPISSAATAGRRWRRVRSPRASIVGAPFSAQDPRPEVRAFVAAYTKQVQHDSGRQRGARLRRDEAARAGGREGRTRPREDSRLSAALSDANAFHGVTGTIRFRADGDPVGKSIVMTRVHRRRDARGGRPSDRASTAPSGNSIRGRLWIGFGVLVAAARRRRLRGARARSPACRARSPQSLAEVQAEAQLASQLSRPTSRRPSKPARAISTRAIRRRRTRSARSAGPRTRCSAQMNDRPGPDRRRKSRPSRRSTTSCRRWKIHYALAHRLVRPRPRATKRGRRRAARAAPIDDLLNDIERLGRLKAEKVADGAIRARRGNRSPLGRG